MTSTTQLTEEEKIELEWESLWERMEASFCKIQREQEAKFDALRKAILDLSLPSKGRLMATTDANSGSYCSTDFEQLEVVPTPWQKTEELESHVLSFSHNSAYYSVRNSARDLDLSKIVDNGSIEQLSGVVKEESMMLGKDAIDNSEEFGNYSIFSLQFCLDAKTSGGEIDHGQVMKGVELEQNQLKKTECLSYARQNAPVRELYVVLPISACYSLSLSWLLNWFPKPMVKLKFIAQYDEEMGGEGNVRRASAKAAGEDQIHVGVVEESGWLLDRDYDASRINKIFEVESGELKKMEHVVNNLTIFGKEKGDSTNFAQFARSLMVVSKSSGFANFLMEQVCSDGVEYDSLVYKLPEDFPIVSRDYPVENSTEESEVSRGLGAGVDDSDGDFEFVDVIVVQALCGLSNIKKDQEPPLKFNCPTYGIVMKNHVVARVDNLDILADYLIKLRGLRNNYREFAGLITRKKTGFGAAGVLFSCQGIKEKYVEMDERAATLERTGIYIVEGDINDNSPLKKHFEIVSFTHVMHLASQAGVRYDMENPSSCVQSNIAGLVYLLEIHKVAKPQPSIVWDSISSMKGLNTKVLFSERNGTDQPTSLYDAAKRAGYGLWGKLEMAYFFFTSDILKGNSIPIFEAAIYETAAVGKSTGCSGKKRIHQLTDIGWMVSVLFPKPRVKMKVWEDKHEKLGSMIPCGQGILRGMDCCKHKLSYAEVVKERFLGSLRTRKLEREVLLHA